jgi:hypothetical protein
VGSLGDRRRNGAKPRRGCLRTRYHRGLGSLVRRADHSAITLVIAMLTVEEITAALSAATGSGSAHALGNQRDTNDCEDGYQELPSVSQRPVVQRSQERLGFGRPGQMADETLSATSS